MVSFRLNKHNNVPQNAGLHMAGFKPRTLHAQQLTWVELLQKVGIKTARLNGQVVQLPLLVALKEDVFLNCLLADQPVDVHLSRLPDAVAPILCLRYSTTVCQAVMSISMCAFIYYDIQSCRTLSRPWLRNRASDNNRTWIP